MTVAFRTTVVGVFFNQQEAEKAVDELRRAGFGSEQIGVVTRQPAPTPPVQANEDTKAEEVGVAGVVTGGVLGGLLGAGAVVTGLIPGMGPILGAGLLAALASGAAAGAVAGGLIGTLIGMGIPEEEARYYQSELEAGKTIVTVRADSRYDQAVEILRRHGAYGKGSPLI